MLSRMQRLRKKIVDEIKRVRGEQAEEDDQAEEDEEPDLSWAQEPNKVEKPISKNIDMIKKIKKSDITSYIRPYAKKLQAFLLKLLGEKFKNIESAYNDYLKNTEKCKKRNR